MKNRAKCKLCNSVIESFHSTDYVACKCGEIAVDAADAMICFARDFKNFVRVDENGNEILVKMKGEDEFFGPPLSKYDIDDRHTEENSIENTSNRKEDLINELDELIKGIERLPQQAILSPITHADFCSLMMLLSAIFKS